MKGLVLVLLLLLPAPASAIRFVKTWDYSDASNSDGSFMPCRHDIMDTNTTGTEYHCKVPVGHTLTITILAAGVRVATSIEDMRVALFDGSANVSASEIEFGTGNGPVDCEASALDGGGDLTTAGNFCRQEFSTALTEGTTYYVALDHIVDGTVDNLQDITIWLEGTLTKN